MLRELFSAELRVAEVHGDEVRRVEPAALRAMAEGVAGLLASRRLQAGDRVGLVAPNGAAWVAADLAMIAAGVVSVPLYTRQAEGELAGMLRDADVSLILADTPERAAALAAATGREAVALADALAHAPVPLVPDVGADDALITMIYTSGTSGEPKGVPYARANVSFMLGRTTSAFRDLMAEHGGARRVFHYLPLCFAGSRIQLWSQLLIGNEVLLSTRLDDLSREIKAAQAGSWLNVPALLERVRAGVEASVARRGSAITWLFPKVLAAMTAVREGRAGLLDMALAQVGERLFAVPFRAALGGEVRFVLCGSAPLSEATQRWFHAMGVEVYQVYGLTETTAIISMDQPGQVAPGFVGLPVEGCEVRRSEDGELLVRGPQNFPGYWRRPDATEQAFVDGWFRTGDLVEVDDAGRLRVLGRCKEVLVPESGHNVPPVPVEEALMAHLPGCQVVLVGHGRPHLVALVAGPATQGDVDAALAAVNPALPHYRRVRAAAVVPTLTAEEGLLTANGKLKRPAIAERFAGEIHGLYA